MEINTLATIRKLIDGGALRHGQLYFQVEAGRRRRLPRPGRLTGGEPPLRPSRSPARERGRVGGAISHWQGRRVDGLVGPTIRLNLSVGSEEKVRAITRKIIGHGVRARTKSAASLSGVPRLPR